LVILINQDDGVQNYLAKMTCWSLSWTKGQKDHEKKNY